MAQLKWTLIGLLAAFLLAGCSPTPPRDESQAATEFLGLLARGQFPKAAQQFDGAMTAALPSEKLQKTWEVLVSRAGPFQQQDHSRLSQEAGYNVVYVTCKFERSLVDMKVVFNAKKQIAGLFFGPAADPKAAAALAPYVKPDVFRDQPVTIGEGKWALPGTLSMPVAEAPLPAMVLVHGSGPCDRDESLGANKPFRDLAGGLASRGVAVLRYDKRTRVHSAEFAALGSQFTVKEETVDDALLAVALLRRTTGIDPQRVFVLGHSLGGMLVPRIGKLETNIAGFVILAGPTAKSLEDRMAEQMDYLQSLSENAAPEKQKQFAELKQAVIKAKAFTAADVNSPTPVLGAPARYWLDLRGYVPAEAAKELACPLLILNGARDYQVPTADFEFWRQTLAARTNVAWKLYPALNHLFIAGEGPGTPAEYEKAGHVDAELIEDIARWVLGGANARK